ncbi:MAG: selenium cofactor biosynthesis protein YqeC [Bacillota bacterium]
MHLFLYGKSNTGALELARRALKTRADADAGFAFARIGEGGLHGFESVPAGSAALAGPDALLEYSASLRRDALAALNLPCRILGALDAAPPETLAVLSRHPRVKLIDLSRTSGGEALDAIREFLDAPPLSEALGVKRGVTALVGGGGKTTLLHRLGKELSASGRTLLCTSTHIMRPECTLLIEPSEQELSRAFGREPLLAMGAFGPDGKLGPCRGELMNNLSALADYVLVEADGSKRLPLKAPAEHEPVLPRETDLVIALAGMSGAGKPIREAAHRPERYAAIVEKPLDAAVTPKDIAKVLEHPFGQKKGVSGRFQVALNQAESPGAYRAALECTLSLNCDAAIVSLLSDHPVIERWRNQKCLW